MKAECVACGETFEAKEAPWAFHRLTGLEAEGYNGTNWYGSDGEWAAADVVEYQQQTGACDTFGRCPVCAEKKLAAMERAREYESDVAPEWFDPGFAGERWDDDY